MENILITGVELCSKQIKILKLQLREYLAVKIKEKEIANYRNDRLSRKRRKERVKVLDDTESDEEPMFYKKCRISGNVTSTDSRGIEQHKFNKVTSQSDSSLTDEEGFYAVNSSHDIIPFNGRKDKNSHAAIRTHKPYRNNGLHRRISIIDSSDSEDNADEGRILKMEECPAFEKVTNRGSYYKRRSHVEPHNLDPPSYNKGKRQTSETNVQIMPLKEPRFKDGKGLHRKANGLSTESSNKRDNSVTIKGGSLQKKADRGQQLIKDLPKTFNDREPNIVGRYKGTGTPTQVHQGSPELPCESDGKEVAVIKNRGGRPSKVNHTEQSHVKSRDLSKKDSEVVLKRNRGGWPRKLNEKNQKSKKVLRRQKISAIKSNDIPVKATNENLSDKRVAKSKEDEVEIEKEPEAKRGRAGDLKLANKPTLVSKPKNGRGRYLRQGKLKAKAKPGRKTGLGRWPPKVAAVSTDVVVTMGAMDYASTIASTIASVLQVGKIVTSKGRETPPCERVEMTPPRDRVDATPTEKMWGEMNSGFTLEGDPLKQEPGLNAKI